MLTWLRKLAMTAVVVGSAVLSLPGPARAQAAPIASGAIVQPVQYYYGRPYYHRPFYRRRYYYRPYYGPRSYRPFYRHYYGRPYYRRW